MIIMEKELISIREFGRRLQVSYAVAQRAVKRGRISMEGEGRDAKVVWPKAKTEFEARRDLTKVRKGNAGKHDININNPGHSANGNGAVPNLWDAKARKEDYLAKIRELDYLERMGKLVDAKVVEDAAFQKAREIRDAFLIIPDRIAAILAKESDPARCHEIMTKEIEAILKKLSE